MANTDEIRRDRERRDLFGIPQIGTERPGEPCPICGQPTVDRYSYRESGEGWVSAHTLRDCVIALTARVKALEEGC